MLENRDKTRTIEAKLETIARRNRRSERYAYVPLNVNELRREMQHYRPVK